MTDSNPQSARPNRRSLAILVLAWIILQIGGLFTPGLLDDVDSIYIEIAREMLHRHDFVTPYIDGIRFFDKPPLMYWLAAGSMHLFGEHAWAARLPLALSILALLFAIYALGLHLFQSERAAFYASLVFATAIGPYLYTRFFIPDLLLCLWLTLGIHLFLIALARIQNHVILSGARSAQSKDPEGLNPSINLSTFQPRVSALLPCLAFAAILALNLLTKGLIGLIFPLAFVLFYLAFTRQLRLLSRFHLIPSTLTFLAVALPWHILAAQRNPAIAMPAGLGLPARAGWAWFYLYNEHVARFLGRRIPQDYGNTPIWLFWLYTLLWIVPWAAFLPGLLAEGSFNTRLVDLEAMFRGDKVRPPQSAKRIAGQRAFIVTVLWSFVVMVFFTVSHRQEYYSLPALPAFALIVGGFLSDADTDALRTRWTVTLHRFLLLPIAALVGATCAFFAVTAPRPQPGDELSSLLSSNPALYDLSLGHIFDLTGAAMGFFRGPLIAVALGTIILGPISYGFRRRAHTYAANLILAVGMTIILLAAHEGLVRFNPILGSRDLALAIVAAQKHDPQPNDLILLDGELTSGSTLLFYTRQPVHLVNGRINGLWFGSFWPDAPPIFETEASLRSIWHGSYRIFLLTYTPASRTTDLSPYGPVRSIASAGGKTILTNR